MQFLLYIKNYTCSGSKVWPSACFFFMSSICFNFLRIFFTLFSGSSATAGTGGASTLAAPFAAAAGGGGGGAFCTAEGCDGLLILPAPLLFAFDSVGPAALGAIPGIVRFCGWNFGAPLVELPPVDDLFTPDAVEGAFLILPTSTEAREPDRASFTKLVDVPGAR